MGRLLTPSKYHAPGHLQNATPPEFTRFRPLRPSKYHAPGRLQNANPREFTRFRPLRLSKYQAPGRLQNTNPCEFTRVRVSYRIYFWDTAWPSSHISKVKISELLESHASEGQFLRKNSYKICGSLEEPKT